MQRSAGLLLFRRRAGRVEVLLAHPGGPFFARKDDGSWSVPKGVVEAGEDDLLAARREFAEETGMTPPSSSPLPLGEVLQRRGKTVVAWAVEGDCDPDRLHSNECSIEWPPRTGRTLRVPEVDRFAFFDLPTARGKIVLGQVPLLDRLAAALAE